MKYYEVTINFWGFEGKPTYTIFAENEEEAIKEAMEVAIDDLYVDNIEEWSEEQDDD